MGNVRSGRIIDTALQKKGFHRVSDGDHVHYYLLRRNGERTSIKTKMSHGMMGSTIDSNIISQMARQLHLTKAQFLDLVDCPLDEASYRAILDGRGETV